MDKKRWIVLSMLFILVSACAAPLPPVADQTAPPPAVTAVIAPPDEVKSSAFGSLFTMEKKKDEELFLQALHQIAGPLNQESSVAARQALESLLSGYPQSKWNDAARATLHLIGEWDACSQRLSVEQDMVQKLATDRNRTLRESEQLKKELRQLSATYQTELAALQQENDQLKKDLQLLKNLEIQLDRRGKTLR